MNDSVLRAMGAVQRAQLEQFAAQLVRLTDSNEPRADALRQAVEVKLQHIRDDNTRQPERMRHTVDEKLQGASNPVDRAATRTRGVERRLRGVEEVPLPQAEPFLVAVIADGVEPETCAADARVLPFFPRDPTAAAAPSARRAMSRNRRARRRESVLSSVGRLARSSAASHHVPIAASKPKRCRTNHDH
jgi:hypothetical protein